MVDKYEVVWCGNLKLTLNHSEPGLNSVNVNIGDSEFTLCTIEEDGTIELSPTKRFTVKSTKNVYAPREEEY